MTAMEEAVGVMRAYATAWTSGDADAVATTCHLPYLVLRAGQPSLRSSFVEVRDTIAQLLPWWTQDASETDQFEALPPLTDHPSTVLVRVRWGAWTLRVPDADPYPSPVMMYIVSRRNGRWGVGGIIAEWPVAKSKQP